jgi:hypothetical protein
MRQQSSTDVNLQQVCDLSVVQHTCVRALPVVQPMCIRAQAILQPAYMLPTSTTTCVYLMSYQGLFFKINLDPLQPIYHSLMFVIVQTDHQPITIHPSSPIAYSFSTTSQYECYSIMHKQSTYYSHHISTES